MKILILGGTGAIGSSLVQLLLGKKEYEVYVTSRNSKCNYKNVKYIKGDAKELGFIRSLLSIKYDVIIDFMVYDSTEFGNRIKLFLDKTSQYFFFSSSRCYADSNVPLTENSNRLVDVCTDEDYLSTDEYAIAKGREENILWDSGRKNWTIIRPYITYNTYRIQLGVFEKEDWLRRALQGRTVVFPKDIAEKKTSLTYAPDVAGALLSLIGNEKAYGQAFHITTDESHTWGEILDFYIKDIEILTGKTIKIKYVENSLGLQDVWNKWQIKYDRLYDRVFCNSKIEMIRGKYTYSDTFSGLHQCLEQFISNPKWLGMNIRYEAWCDKQCGEWTPLTEISGKKNKLKYLKYRLTR